MWGELDAAVLPESRSARTLRLALIVGLHGLVIAGALTATMRPEMAQLMREIQVRLIEIPPPEAPRLRPEPPKPQPRVQQPVVRREPAPLPSVVTAAPEAPAPAPSFSVPPQPAAPAAEVALPPAPPAPVTPARFDADYLHNPAPAYPAMSRRLGEQGRVVLHVRVLANGTAAQVEVKSSSGFPRLDQAASDAVGKWRFVPSRRGDEPIDAWVLVPINFALDR